MGWVRFLLAAAAFPAILAGIALLLPEPHAELPAANDPVQAAGSASDCAVLQSLAVASASAAQRDLEASPARAFAAANDALIAAELARIVCDPTQWADTKIRSAPVEWQQLAYQALSEGMISDFDQACQALEAGLLSDGPSREMIVETGRMDFALALHSVATDQVCTDRPRHRIGPPARPQSGI